ncbi:MAG: hypothetical protein HKM93_10560 [Desulfobacteraceae bacterium]|nr:hypothetical protein [Desulfobacteraceae bacterium]
MSAEALFQSLYNHLDVRAYVLKSSIQGDEIQEGESFTLRVRVTNNAPGGGNHPDIRFRITQVRVRRTEFARPEAGNTITTNLEDDTYLTRNDDGRLDVPMRAVKAIGGPAGTIPGLLPELIARVTVRAEVDQDAFFRVRKTVTAIGDIVTN